MRQKQKIVELSKLGQTMTLKRVAPSTGQHLSCSSQWVNPERKKSLSPICRPLIWYSIWVDPCTLAQRMAWGVQCWWPSTGPREPKLPLCRYAIRGGRTLNSAHIQDIYRPCNRGYISFVFKEDFALAYYCTLLQDSRRREWPPKSIGLHFLQCISNGCGPSFVAPRAPTHKLPVYDQSV